ncbi:unnamed protein product [Rotaria sordida]|uniref:Uncharacterized protein n=1 Tax=Rotaria sordida TaxID=392033 RepID=A0A815H1L7_9BILA|nr:unnamed protein product [Rotaria sordida]CAF3934783.1 unnamed protein product [Rotaria sordida]
MDNNYTIFDLAKLEELYQQYCQQPQNNSQHCELSSLSELKWNMNDDLDLIRINEYDLMGDTDDNPETKVNEKKNAENKIEVQEQNEINKQEIEKWKELIQSYYEHIKQLEQLQNK